MGLSQFFLEMEIRQARESQDIAPHRAERKWSVAAALGLQRERGKIPVPQLPQ